LFQELDLLFEFMVFDNKILRDLQIIAATATDRGPVRNFLSAEHTFHADWFFQISW